MASLSLPIPFTVTDETYHEAFKLALTNMVGKVESYVAGPLLTCVTLWLIVQGILVMRGDITARSGITKIIMVALVASIISSSSLYSQFVENLFEQGVPSMVQQLGGDFGAPNETIPFQMDAAFRIGQAGFLATSAGIPMNDDLDSLNFEGAQLFYYFTMWSIFAIYDLIDIMVSVLVTFGPLFLLAFLFDFTRGIAKQWIGQLIGYSILLLFASVVASIVIATIAAYLVATFGAAAALTAAGNAIGTAWGVQNGGKAGQIVGLYEVDMFIMTGNALVVALPAIAASIGGGVAAQASAIGQSLSRHLAKNPSPTAQSINEFLGLSGP